MSHIFSWSIFKVSASLQIQLSTNHLQTILSDSFHFFPYFPHYSLSSPSLYLGKLTTPHKTIQQQLVAEKTMAAASATLSPATFTAAAANAGRTPQKRPNVKYISGLNSFGGLKAQNYVVSSLGLPVCTEQSFANFVCSLKFPSQGSTNGGGGALTATCNAVGEIFRIAAVINGLVLVGVAVGFVLLRIEASVEESE